MCRPATARAVTVGGTLLAVVVGLSGWVGTSSGASTQGRVTAVNLTGGVEGTGHPGMSASMPGMNMAAAKSDPAQGAYLKQTPYGSVHLRQTGEQLSGLLSVSGLPPGSHHAAGLLGPASGCSAHSERSATVAIALPVLVANAAGVARTRLNLIVHHQVISRGYVVVVDRDPTVGEIDGVGSVTSAPGLPRTFTQDPPVLCGAVQAP